MGLINVLKSIGHGIKVAAIKVAHGFAAIFGHDAAVAFGHAALDLLKSALGKIVVEEVQALSTVDSLSGVEKFAKAQAAILEKAKAAGISVSTSIVNLLIEVAVAFVKGNLEAIQ
jgi:hypothetical protein